MWLTARMDWDNAWEMNDSNPAMHIITPFWQMTTGEAAKGIHKASLQ